MLGRQLNSFVAIAMILAVGIGASYIIIRVANSTNFSVVSTNESITFTAEIQKNGHIKASVER